MAWEEITEENAEDRTRRRWEIHCGDPDGRSRNKMEIRGHAWPHIRYYFDITTTDMCERACIHAVPVSKYNLIL